jgi:NADPH:quinone reductase
MLALLTTGDPTSPLTISETPEPTPRASEVLVSVEATSLNPGEVRTIGTVPPATCLGWDVAGTVVESATDGSGPPAGTRVCGLVGRGAWAQRVAVPTHALAQIPDAVTSAHAATLPIAGLTAWRALEHGGLLLGQQVLVTGAAGGVGRLAVQLAHHAGATVTAVVGRPSRATGLAALGAAEIVIGIENAQGSYDLVLESVGGASLTHGLNHLAQQGILVSYGRSSLEAAHIDPSWFMTHSGASMVGLLVFTEVLERRLGTDQLASLMQLVAEGALDPQVALEDSWRNATSATKALLARDVAGKAVLHID